MTHFILCYVSFAAPQTLNSVNLQRSAGRHGPEFIYLKERKCSSVCITVSLYNQLPLSQGYILRCCINIYIARIPSIHVYAQKKSLRIHWIKTWMDDHRMLYSREEKVRWRQQSLSLCTASWSVLFLMAVILSGDSTAERHKGSINRRAHESLIILKITRTVLNLIIINMLNLLPRTLSWRTGCMPPVYVN